MPKMPSLSSKELVKLVENGGAKFVRQGKTDHAIYSKVTTGRRYSAPIQMGKKSLNLKILAGLRKGLIMHDSFWIGVYPGMTEEMIGYTVEQIWGFAVRGGSSG